MLVSGQLPEDSAIGWLFGAAATLTVAGVHRVITQHSLSPTGLSVLLVLDGEDGLKSTEVAARVSCTPATLTTVAGTLERHGHLRRQVASSDHRVVELHVTRRGRAQAGRARHEIDRWYGDLFGFVEPPDELVIRPFLRRVIGRLGAGANPPKGGAAHGESAGPAGRAPGGPVV